MYTLLIVDDEAIEREAIQYIIKQAGLKFKVVEEAVNGIQAVAKATAFMPEIIIMDIKMPGKDGLEAAKEIRKFNHHCKIIFLTAFNEFEYARKAIKVKAEDFIIKPVYNETLIEVLISSVADLDGDKTSASVGTSSSSGFEEPFPDDTEADDIVTGSSALLVEKVCKYIDQNYHKNIKLDEMCEMVGFSKFYFSRIFKQNKNIKLVDYITLRRIEKTKELLKNPQNSIKEISSLVGYSEANYLTSVFKKWEGISPTEYRNKQCR